MNFKDIIIGIFKTKSNDIKINHTEESQKMINFLLEDIYSDSSSINISNDSYHFAHENLIEKVNIYEIITKKILDSPLNRKEIISCLIKKEKLFLLEIIFKDYDNSTLFNDDIYLMKLLELFYSEENETDCLIIIGNSPQNNVFYYLSKESLNCYQNEYQFFSPYSQRVKKIFSF